MKSKIAILTAIGLALSATTSLAAEKLVISTWGGSWKDLLEKTVAKKFKEQTGADVEFITGGTIDRLNKAKLAKGNPESDITFTTSHVGWLYATDGLYDASHLVVVSAKLMGGDAATWEKGSDKLKALKPNFKAYYANDAASQQLLQNGEAPVQVMLSMNAYHIASQGVPVKVAMPKEGAVLGIDTVGIMKGTKNADLAYKFVNLMLDPDVQAEVATIKKGSPVVSNAKLSDDVAKLPGVFTTPDQWNKEALIIDHKLRAEKTGEWRKWFTENVIN